MAGSRRQSAAAGGISSLELSGDHMVAALGAHGAFASADAGVTWKACGEPAPSTIWYGLAFDCRASEPAHGAGGHLRRLVSFDRRLRFMDQSRRGFVGGHRQRRLVPSHQAGGGFRFAGRPGFSLHGRRPALAAARRRERWQGLAFRAGGSAGSCRIGYLHFSRRRGVSSNAIF